MIGATTVLSASQRIRSQKRCYRRSMQNRSFSFPYQGSLSVHCFARRSLETLLACVDYVW